MWSQELYLTIGFFGHRHGNHTARISVRARTMRSSITCICSPHSFLNHNEYMHIAPTRNRVSLLYEKTTAVLIVVITRHQYSLVFFHYVPHFSQKEMVELIHFVLIFNFLFLSEIEGFQGQDYSGWLPAHATFYGASQNPTILGKCDQ